MVLFSENDKPKEVRKNNVQKKGHKENQPNTETRGS
jgi:hypothetical protein